MSTLSRSAALRAALRTVSLGAVALLLVNSSVFGQSRGGGGGRGRSGGFGAAPSQSPMQRVRDELKLTDYFDFLDDKGKQIGLEKTQKDSVKVLNKQMEEQEKPVLKEIEKLFNDAERTAAQDGGGGGRSRGEGGRGGRGGMPEGARALIQQLMGMQEDYAMKAHALLNDSQKHMADSLNVIYLDKLRDRQRNRSRG